MENLKQSRLTFVRIWVYQHWAGADSGSSDIRSCTMFVLGFILYIKMLLCHLVCDEHTWLYLLQISLPNDIIMC